MRNTADKGCRSINALFFHENVYFRKYHKITERDVLYEKKLYLLPISDKNI